MKRIRALSLILAVVWAAGTTGPSHAHTADQGVDPIANRYLAFGDSITYGGWDTPYPARLEGKLDIRVASSEVLNAGVPGERIYGGSERIDAAVADTTPQYVLIMEGTNDVTARSAPAAVYDNVLAIIDNARNAGVNNIKILFATLIPRLDELNDETDAMNREAIRPAAAARGVPVCDLWQAFMDRPSWRYLYRPHDNVHPNSAGLQLMADTFYACLLASFPEVAEETTPPTAWISSLAASSECGQVPVGWTGTDNLNWVVDYDVQARLNDGPWTNWLAATPQTDGTYTADRYDDVLGFRVRARDLLGNQGEWSTAAETRIADSGPPYAAGVDPLPAIRVAPFGVSWWAADACADVTAYDVEYRVGTGAWQPWLAATPYSSGSFAPAGPQYGETYSFRVRARDEALNWGAWSEAGAPTVLARAAVSGLVFDVRHRAVAGTTATVTPAPLALERRPAGFTAYVAGAGPYEVSVSGGSRYGPLPPMRGLSAAGPAVGVELVLPPLDDAVTGGGFEAGSLAAWGLGGAPSLAEGGHTGQGAVRLPAGGSVEQQMTLPAGLTSPTLSFFVRLEGAGPAGSVQVALAGVETVTHTLPVEGTGWVHAWYDLSGMAGSPLTVRLAVRDGPAVLADEISLGSAVPGGYLVYVPLMARNR